MASLVGTLKQKPISTGATAVYKVADVGQQSFTTRHGEDVMLGHVVGDLIHLPRAMAPIGKSDVRVLGHKVSFDHKIVLRENQKVVADDTVGFLEQGLSGIVQAYTGWGKTILGFYAAAMIGRKTLVITSKDDIYQKWVDDAPKFLGLDPKDVGEIRGSKCEVKGRAFCVAMIHSISKTDKYPDWITDEFGLIIFDECHRLAADHFEHSARMFPAMLRLGLSAQDDRGDGKWPLVEAHIGPIRVRTTDEGMVPRVLRYKSPWVCPRVARMNPKTGAKDYIRLPHEAGKTAHVEKRLMEDEGRNAMLLTMIESALQANRRIVVFSVQIVHLEHLRDMLLKGGMKPEAIGIYKGSATKKAKEERDEAKKKDVVLTTYAMCGEGTDQPWWDTCLLAIPRSNCRQPVGRIRRVYEGKKFPIVMDLIDWDSPVFAAYAYARKKWFDSIGAEVKEMD